MVPTRNRFQLKSHGQKLFLKIKKLYKVNDPIKFIKEMKNHLDLLENYANNETLNTKCRREIYKKVNGYGNSIQSTLDSQTSINRINNELVNNSSNTDFAQPNELKYIKYIENYINKLES